MLRALCTPRWLGALVLSALFAALAYQLGFWQYHRYEAKRDNADRVTAHYDAPAKPLGQVLDRQPLPKALEWTRVSATGTFAEPGLLVRARTRDGDVGFEALAPLRLTDGETVLVDRGWLPYAANASVVPAVPPPPSGSVTITGWVRQGESSRDRNLPGEQLATINLAEASTKIQEPLLGGYLLLDAPTGVSDAVTPRSLGRPDLGLGPHLAYAYQWWFSVPMGFVLIVLGLRRERRLAAQGAPVSGQPQAESGRPKKKVRIWDEEDA